MVGICYRYAVVAAGGSCRREKFIECAEHRHIGGISETYAYFSRLLDRVVFDAFERHRQSKGVLIGFDFCFECACRVGICESIAGILLECAVSAYILCGILERILLYDAGDAADNVHSGVVSFVKAFLYYRIKVT